MRKKQKETGIKQGINGEKHSLRVIGRRINPDYFLLLVPIPWG